MAVPKLSLLEAQNRSLGARVDVLEAEVTKLKQLKQVLEANAKPTSSTSADWLDSIAGSFANDPGFDEMVELGRQYRESLRPKPPRKRTARKAGNRQS